MRHSHTSMDAAELNWGEDGLLPVVIADARTNEVLTLAYANREALQRTIDERTTYLYSRSRKSLWRKGEQSGNTQEVLCVRYDCDADALLYLVTAHGPACHTGERSCFHRNLFGNAPSGDRLAGALAHLARVIEARASASPETSYVARLRAGGVDRIGKKIGEEATEVVIAAKNASREELVWESADLLFHLIVLLEHAGVSPDEVGGELLRRAT